MSSFMELYDEGRKRLAASGIREYEYDARQLILFAFDMDMNRLLMNYTADADEAKAEKYLNMIDRRAEHVPLQYITGFQCFCGLDFKVNENVLIPRQDTEVLIEKILEDDRQSAKEDMRVLDMCTGSGCIAVTLKKLGGYGFVCGADISREALMLADENAGKNGAEMIFYESDMFSQLNDAGSFDIIVSNPPYIRSSIIEQLIPEVREHEPKIALDGYGDGLHFYRIIAENASGYLKENGRIYLEIGYDQAKDVSALFSDRGFERIETVKDLAGLDRVLAIYRQ